MINVLVLLLKGEFPKKRIIPLDELDRLLKPIDLTVDKLFRVFDHFMELALKGLSFPNLRVILSETSVR